MEENPTAPDVVKDGPGTNVGTKNNNWSSPLGNPKGEPRQEGQPQAPEESSDKAEKR